MSALKEGQAVNVQYTGYSIRGTIVTFEPHDWIVVRQDSDYEDVPEGERPVFPCAAEYVFTDEQDAPLAPFEHLARAMWGTR